MENCSTHFGLELWEDPFLHEALRNLVLDLCEAHGCELVERVEVLLPSDCGGDDVGPDVYSTAACRLSSSFRSVSWMLEMTGRGVGRSESLYHGLKMGTTVLCEGGLRRREVLVSVFVERLREWECTEREPLRRNNIRMFFQQKQDTTVAEVYGKGGRGATEPMRARTHCL